MLLEFRVGNHRSIGGEQALSFAATRIDPDDRRLVKVEALEDPLLPVIALYGANASGKTSVLSALLFMRACVTSSQTHWEPDLGVPRTPFGWGSLRKEVSFFELTFVVDGVRMEYGFAADDASFTEEWLHAYPRGRRQVWFDREGQSFEFGEHLKGENKLVQQVTRPNALFLSAAVQLHHAQLTPIFQWFRQLRGSVPPRHRAFRGGGEYLDHWLSGTPATMEGERPAEQREELERRRTSLLALLQNADVGIIGLKLEEDDSTFDTRSARLGRARRRLLFRHSLSSEDSWLSLEEESHGTRTLLELAPNLFHVLWNGGVLVVDELEASLHPLLALRIIELFHNPETNPRGAQLLFTTHDTNLIGTVPDGKAVLRRDQVWLTEKVAAGTTRLYSLSDYQPRRAENLERGYLQGRYGGIPFLRELLEAGEKPGGRSQTKP